MLHAVHGNLERAVADGKDVVGNTGNLVAEHESARIVVGHQRVDRPGSVRQFDGEDAQSIGLQQFDGLHGIPDGDPRYGIVGSECRLVDLRTRWRRRIAGEDEALDTEGIGRTEDRSHIVHAADILQDDGHRVPTNGRSFNG